MKYETYDKDKHTLEVGTKIRLAGREGEIVKLDSWGKTHTVRWPMPDTGSEQELYLGMFPSLEIAISPLTIDKRVKHKIQSIFANETVRGCDIELIKCLNSLEET